MAHELLSALKEPDGQVSPSSQIGRDAESAGQGARSPAVHRRPPRTYGKRFILSKPGSPILVSPDHGVHLSSTLEYGPLCLNHPHLTPSPHPDVPSISEFYPDVPRISEF